MRARLLLLVLAFAAGCGRPLDGRVADARTQAVQALASAILERHADGEAGGVLNPLGRDQEAVVELERRTLDALRDALRGKVSLETATPALKQGAAENPGGFGIAPGSTAPLSYLMEPDAFARLAREHAGAGLIISLVGFPKDGLAHPCPPVALLFPDLRALGTKDEARRAVEDGRVVALVLPGRPGEPPRLITRANAGEL